MKIVLRTKTVALIFTITVLATFTSISPLLTNDTSPIIEAQSYSATATDQQKLDAIQRQLAELRKKKQDINDAIQVEKNKQGSYTSEIRLINQEKSLIESEIAEKELMIQELGLQIDILKKTIVDTEKVIAKTKVEVESLESEAEEQLADMYLDIKTNNNSLNLIFSDGSKNLVKTGLYQKSIQEETNNSLRKLQEKNQQLKEDQKRLEADKIAVEEDKAEVDKEKEALDKKRSELQAKTNKLWTLFNAAQTSIEKSNAVRESLSGEEAKLLAEQELINQRLFNSVRNMNNGTFVLKGTIIGYQGLTGLTTGYHLHFGVQYDGVTKNPCSYLPSGVIGGCAGNGQIAWPFKGNFYYTSGYGSRCFGSGSGRYCSFHSAIDIAHPVHNAPIYAAHDGWYKRGFEPCPAAYKNSSLCKAGGANYVVLCENKADCSKGFRTLYMHLK